MQSKEPTIETVEKLEITLQDISELMTPLKEYHAIFAPLFTRREQREWAKDYILGPLSPEMDRKSIEPMVLNARGANAKNAVRAMQQFIGEGSWCDDAIRKRHWQEVEITLGEEDGVIPLDGSDFPKQGKESVGVKEQETILWGIGQTGQLPGWRFCRLRYARDTPFWMRGFTCLRSGLARSTLFGTRDVGSRRRIVFKRKTSWLGRCLKPLIGQEIFDSAGSPVTRHLAAIPGSLIRSPAWSVGILPEVPRDTRVWTRSAGNASTALVRTRAQTPAPQSH